MRSAQNDRERRKKDKVNEKWQIILQDILDSMSDSRSRKVSFQKDVVDYLDGENARE